jgi:hypothetical protein
MAYAQYLGDGVYAQYDGFHIVLSTGSHDLAEATNIIYLDPSTLHALGQYSEYLARELNEKPEQHT